MPGGQGLFVGDAPLGTNVGDALGSDVGAALPATVGDALGSDVGAALPATVGDALGSNVGAALPATVGDALGSDVGTTLGADGRSGGKDLDGATDGAYVGFGAGSHPDRAALRT